MTRYSINVSFNKKGIEKLKNKLDGLVKNLPLVEKRFVELSLDYIEQHAKTHLAESVNQEFSTGELMSHFKKEYDLGLFINDCFYAAFVEYGTGIVGEGTHPDAKGYQYDVNSHGENGWYYFKDGQIHFTKGMAAHRYMYNTLIDYLTEYRKIFEKAFDEVMGGILKE